MNKKDILELKRRFKKDACTVTRVCGCYVDADSNKVTTFGETFLNLEDEEFYKYLEIAKKILSGTIGNNILELGFSEGDKEKGGRQQFLMGIRESAIKNDELMETFYDLVISSYDYVGNYLILIFHDAYDVMMKTSDNNKLDESEEVYEYLLCAICPVTLSKPGLGYREDENRIGARIRDWVVGVPDTGFVFPAFTDRSTDIDSVMFYTRDTKNYHEEFMEAGLGCNVKLTSTKKKQVFDSIVERYFGDDEEIYAEIQEELNNRIKEACEDLKQDDDMPDLQIMPDDIEKIFYEVGLQEETALKAKEQFACDYEDDYPDAQQIVDEKEIEKNKQKREVKELKSLLVESAQELKKYGNIELVRKIEEKTGVKAVK